MRKHSRACQSYTCIVAWAFRCSEWIERHIHLHWRQPSNPIIFGPVQLRPVYTTSGLQPHHRPHNVAAKWCLFFRGFCHGLPLTAQDFILHGLHVKAMSLAWWPCIIRQAHPLGAVQDASQVPEPRNWRRIELHGFPWLKRHLELRNWPLPWSMQQACERVGPYVQDENQVVHAVAFFVVLECFGYLLRSVKRHRRIRIPNWFEVSRPNM